jgi:hypothetical protein
MLDEEYAIKPDECNANWRQGMEAIGKVLFTGVMCEDGGYYGASDTAHCRLTLPDDFTEVGDILHIGDGSREWRVTVTVDNAIEFTDTQLHSGTAGTANYDTIKNLLRFWTMANAKLTKIVTRNEIALGAHAEALHGDDIRISDTEATTVEDLFDDFYVEHELGGAHSSDIIGNANLKKDEVLTSQGFLNMVKNGEFWLHEEASKRYWEEVGTPVSVTPTSNPCGSFPRHVNTLVTDAQGEGIRQAMTGIEQNQPCRLVFWGQGNAGGEKIIAELLVSGGASAHVDIVLTTTWTKYYLDFTPDDSCNLYVRFISDDSGSATWRLAKVNVAQGDVHSCPERAPRDYLLDDVKYASFYTPNIRTGGFNIAQFTPRTPFELIGIEAFARTAPNADVTIRISDGGHNEDLVFTSGETHDYVAAEYYYGFGSALTISAETNSDSASTDVQIILHYRYY